MGGKRQYLYVLLLYPFQQASIIIIILVIALWMVLKAWRMT